MVNIPVVPEQAEFVKNLVHLTRRGDIAWETTADPDIMLAALGDEYSVRLQQVPDLEQSSQEPDHQISLFKGRRLLFSLDRTSFPSSEPFETLYPNTRAYVYTVFKEIWDRAYLKANKISDELAKVNRILSSKLEEDDEVPF
jgi:hypothetical protein